MRTLPVILAGVLLCSAPAGAQVTTNQGALDALGKPARTPAPHRPHPAAHSRTPAPAAQAGPTAKPDKPAAAAKPPPTVPTTPPAILALPPPVVVPLAHPPLEPTVPVADDAPGDATRIAGGLRVTFGPDRADLNPATVAALRDFARGLVEQSGTSISILAYATGSPDDPSTPRRLSLSRALAARAVLIQAGIASPRIYPRALGPAGGNADPDRVDVVTGAPTPPSRQDHAG